MKSKFFIKKSRFKINGIKNLLIFVAFAAIIMFLYIEITNLYNKNIKSYYIDKIGFHKSKQALHAKIAKVDLERRRKTKDVATAELLDIEISENMSEANNHEKLADYFQKIYGGKKRGHSTF